MASTTPSQTVGPYLQIGLAWLDTDTIAPAGVAGERVRIRGRMLDGDAKPIADGLLEIWQADPAGRFDNPAFRGFGRVPTKSDGTFAFTTIRPGRIGSQAPHLLVGVFARGLLKRAVTRMYFPGDATHDSDPLLSLVEPARRATLVARPAGDGSLEWNIVLQGPHETVFFDL
ncbi:Protocatechuate 3,4-dioxygenase alpha chain [Usitatibacter rugosus]|uniref:Protocatechuate 3,4-dioxygenase alpha chain n=1 Tax=Usitatibacter rugosus TaxID=2732067 RepID=A0A6M4GX43_9PROT|nr:protocatechuate 3,4-dioxygenase subunit alpha [Usitatibacter rugosus]QJR11438.1 Protocatechuate 3,4-dioxygenase alpha chain [Usitatibacter rugosus]